MVDYKKDADKFVPWEDEEGRKRKPKRGDSIPPKTNIQSRVHSKPKTDGQEYLDMYIRSKEKERMEKFGEIVRKRLKNISDAWRDMKKDLVKKEKELPKVPKGGIEDSDATEGSKTDTNTKKKKIPRYMKKVDWNY